MVIVVVVVVVLSEFEPATSFCLSSSCQQCMLDELMRPLARRCRHDLVDAVLSIASWIKKCAIALVVHCLAAMKDTVGWPCLLPLYPQPTYVSVGNQP